MPVTGHPWNLYIGLEYSDVANLKQCVEYARSNRFDSLVVPIAHPRHERTARDQEIDDEPWARSDLHLDSKTWNTAIFASISKWINLDSPCMDKLTSSRAAFVQEMKFALHLGVYGAVLPAPCMGMDVEGYAQAINSFLLDHVVGMQLWIRIPLVAVVETHEGTQLVEGWHIWNKLRKMIDQPGSLAVALEFTEDIPVESGVLERWLGEPVKLVVLPSELFINNKKGYPVMPKRHKQFLVSLFKLKLQVVISPGSDLKNVKVADYMTFVARLFNSKPGLNGVENFAHPYNDHLQMPLQPLADNLESQIYEVFEQDPVKYVQYEEAVLAALKDRIAEGKTRHVIMVVGAGRGPLVAASRSASRRANANCVIWAVEKNPNAVVTLRWRKKDEKWDDVTIIAHDMRTWKAPCKADIMVSELLGSFGDNELSPECLDGAQSFLASDGINIPQSYYSTMRPVSTCRLWNEIRNNKKLSALETPYVVYLHQCYYPCETQKVFSYEHPNWEQMSNDREMSCVFTADQDCLIHGFAGYFHCDLYKNISISIDPATYSEGMFSWFPIYFPIREPFDVRKGEKIRINVWRKSTESRVWYEWSFSSPVVSQIHNPAGRSYTISK